METRRRLSRGTIALFVVGTVLLLAVLAGFGVAVWVARGNDLAFEAWIAEDQPLYDFRAVRLPVAADALILAGLAAGLGAIAWALWRRAGERNQVNDTDLRPSWRRAFGRLPVGFLLGSLLANGAVVAVFAFLRGLPHEPEPLALDALGDNERMVKVQTKMPDFEAGQYAMKKIDGVDPQLARQQAVDAAKQAGPLGQVSFGLDDRAVYGGLIGNEVGESSGGFGFGVERYQPIVENPWHAARGRRLSTFSIDVDTASYANVRRYLETGVRPPEDAVRIEELINYFRYDYPPPERDEPFATVAEVGPAPWNPSHRLVHLGLRTRAIETADVPPRNLVFLIDVSGSMASWDKLDLLKEALGLLVAELRPQDRVSIVVYAGASGLVLRPTPGDRKQEIHDALTRLEAGGSTNGGAGIELAYKLARATFLAGGINRVILATDGDFNVGVTSMGELEALIAAERKSGVFLTVLGVGTGNINDATMELLADKGNGNYAYLDSVAEARKVLVREAGATLVTVAKDVKIQVDFDEEAVQSYRLIGYENRALADRDFADDRKDAGEIGSGRAVTAIYEVVPRPGATRLMTLDVRYKTPDGEASRLIRREIVDAGLSLTKTSNDFRFAAAVAGFGMLLRGSEHAGRLDWKDVHALALGALGTDASGDRRAFLTLVGRAAQLDAPRM